VYLLSCALQSAICERGTPDLARIFGPTLDIEIYSEIQSRGHLATNLAHRLSLKGCSDNFAKVFFHKKLFVVIKKNKIINPQMDFNAKSSSQVQKRKSITHSGQFQEDHPMG